MATNLRILWNNLLQGSGVTVTPDNENTNFPATNTLLDQRQLVYRSSAIAAAYNVKYDFGAAKAITAACFFDANALQSDSYILEASANNFSTVAFSTTPTASNLTPSAATVHVKNRFVLFIFAAQTYRYWRIRPGGATPAIDAFQSFSKAFLGTYLEPTKNYAYGMQLGVVDLSETWMTPNGADNTARRPAFWEVAFDMPLMSRTSDAADLRALVDSVGTFQPVVCILDQDLESSRQTLYGKFTRNPGFAPRRGALVDVMGYGFRESI